MFQKSQRGVKTVDLQARMQENHEKVSFFQGFFNKFLNVLEQRAVKNDDLWAETLEKDQNKSFLSSQFSQQVIKILTYGLEFRATLTTVYCIVKN